MDWTQDAEWLINKRNMNAWADLVVEAVETRLSELAPTWAGNKLSEATTQKEMPKVTLEKSKEKDIYTWGIVLNDIPAIVCSNCNDAKITFSKSTENLSYTDDYEYNELMYFV